MHAVERGVSKLINAKGTRLNRILAVTAWSLVLGGSSLHAQRATTKRSEVLWYRTPSPIWDNALPIGNGRLGAMVFGGANTGASNGDSQDRRQNAPLIDGAQTSAADEHLQLNESSLWQGSRANRLNPCASAAVPKIRQLLLDSKGIDGEKISAAEKMASNCMIGRPPGMPGYSTLGDLYLRAMNKASIPDYRRQLDLNTGVVSVTYTMSGIHYKREIFASVPDQVIVVHLTADRRNALSFRASMDRPADFAVRANGQNTLVLQEGPEHKDQIRFAGETLVLPAGGTVRADNSDLVVDKADSVTILIVAATDFKGGPFQGGDPKKQCEAALAKARTRSASQMLARQEALYQPEFQRMGLHLGAAQDSDNDLPTDERIKRISDGIDDLGLQELYFQFARYLLISSSRPDGLPANLQGIWASGISNPWGSKWTINVNAEMNYWLAEPAGLSETALPLINLIDMVRTPSSGTGTQVAQTYYKAHGFVIHHNTDIWGDADPIDIVGSGIWPMGGAWLSLHAWDHYAYTGDKQFLKIRAWPILHDASMFFLDYLVDDGSGHLVTGPSLSPENTYLLPDGSRHSLTMGPTMDIELVRELFTRTFDAGKILGEDPAFLKKLADAQSKLPPFKVGKLGQLQEWQQDYDESEPGHRHISHLWALYPGTQISLEKTPELAAAARITLERRLSHGGGQTGWSRAWVINYWDHLHDSKQAYESMQVMFRQSTFPNLMDTHPPGLFQIDGNLGAASGMLESLIQSRWYSDRVEVDFLPALPQEWSDGSVNGVHVRGNAEVAMRWSGSHLVSVSWKPKQNQRFRVRLPQGQHLRSITAADRDIRVHEDDSGTVDLQLAKGKIYKLEF
jgi:alpha-L-fucosidase 2